MTPTKVAVIGAGSACFGLNTLGSLMKSLILKGSHIALVDRNAKTQALVRKLTQRMGRTVGELCGVCGVLYAPQTPHFPAHPGNSLRPIRVYFSLGA